MGLTKAAVAYSGIMPNLAEAINAWQPKKCKSEQECRDALLEHLRGVVPQDARVEREYRDHGTTADLYLSWKGVMMNAEVFFELKQNLKKKSDFDRLVGQIEGLDPRKHNVMVILFGETDQGLVARLREKYNDVMHHDHSGYDACMLILEVKC